MCNTWKLGRQEEELTKDQIVETIFAYSKSHSIRSVRFLGGEPLVREDMTEIIGAASSSVATEMVTNGTLITPELAEALVRSGLHNLRVSIDGPEAVNDRLRGKGSFQKSSRALDMVREAKERLGVAHPEVTVWQCISRLNRWSLREMYLFAKSKGAGFAMFFLVDGPDPLVGNALWSTPTGIRRLVDPSRISLTLEERRRVTLGYFDMLASLESRSAVGAALTRLGARLRLWYSKFGTLVYRDCSRSMHAILIDPWGNYFPCEYLYMYHYGNCLADGTSAWGSGKHRQLRRAIRSGSMPACQKCNHFGQYRSMFDCLIAPRRLIGRSRTRRLARPAT